jgi:hypothetical protein
MAKPSSKKWLYTFVATGEPANEHMVKLLGESIQKKPSKGYPMWRLDE